MDIQVKMMSMIFNRDQANMLYNEIEVIRRSLDPEYFRTTMLCAIFDSLNELGIAGDD